MGTPDTSPEHARVWAAVRDINRASREANLPVLARRVHERVTIVLGGAQRVGESREIFLKSVEDFAARGIVHDYQEHDPAIDIFGDTAVVAFRYTSDWEADGTRVRETGHELLVLVRDGDGWVLAWRNLTPQSTVPNDAAVSGEE